MVDNGNQEACPSQGRVVEQQMVVNWCICNGRIGVGEGYRFLFCLRRGVTSLLGKKKGRASKFFRKKDEKYPNPPSLLKLYLPLAERYTFLGIINI